MLGTLGGAEDPHNIIAEARDIFGGDTDAEVLDRLRKAYKSANEYQGMMMGAEIGSIIGATLGRTLGGDSATAGIAFGSLVGEIGERFGLLIGGGFSESSFAEATVGGLEVFGHDVALRAGAAAVGTVSTWLSMELGEALGLRGFGAELFTTSGAAVTSHIIGNLLAQGPSLAFAGVNTVELGRALGGVTGTEQNPASFTSNLSGALANALGSFLGARLGALVVSPQTQAAAILSSIGSAVGAYVAVQGMGVLGTAATAIGNFVASRLGATIGNAVVPGIGAFVGFVLGALIGNLFGRKKPRVPTANAEVYLDYTSDQFQLGNATAANGGNLELVRNIATTARDTLNGFLTVLAGDLPFEATSWGQGLWRNGQYIAAQAGVQTFYGHTGGQLWVRTGNPNAAQQDVASADDAVSRGVIWAIRQTQVIGGDLFAKRALAMSPATDLTALLGDLQIASDYRFYANNRELINGSITGAYNSLNQAEKDFYAANKATIDKAHVQGLDALDGNERSVYNANQATIDRIIGALEDQAIANPWIITLQRISELKLDQWAPSDFYGGMQGFLTSLGIEGYGTHFEDVKVTSVLGGMTLSVDSTPNGSGAQDGVFSLLPQALDGPMQNDLLNPRWQQGAAGWWQASWMTSTGEFGVNLNADWYGNGNDVFWSRMNGPTTVGAVVDVRSELIASTAGRTYEVSVKAARHRGSSQLFVEFYDVNRYWMGATFISGDGREYGAWHGDLNTFDTISGQVVAPPGAVYRNVGLRLVATGENDPYAFFTQPTTREVGGPALDWSTGGNALRIDDLAKINYSSPGDTNTNGNDFVDFSKATGPVTWMDWHEESYTEYGTGYDGFPYEQTITYTITGGDDVVVGSAFGDTLYGEAGWDWLDGGEGNDILDGADGNDVLLGGGGRDRLVGGAGDDYLVSGAGDDHPWTGANDGAGMWGGTGNDTIVFNGGIDGGFGEDGDDTFLMEQDGYSAVGEFNAEPAYDGNIMDYVDAGNGSDTVSYERYTTPVARSLDANFWSWATNASAMPSGGVNGVVVALWNHPSAWVDPYWSDAKYIMGDWIKGVENVTGSRFNDYLWGDAGDNAIKGGDGDDILDGNVGNDVLEGGAGADYMVGPGEGTLSYEGSNAGVFIDMTTGEAFGGHATGDRWLQMDHLRGSRFADELKGDAGSNRITALEGDDWIVSSVGGDIYDGGEGLDTADFSEGNSLSLSGGTANWWTTDGAYVSSLLYNIEHVVGTIGADYISMSRRCSITSSTSLVRSVRTTYP